MPRSFSPLHFGGTPPPDTATDGTTPGLVQVRMLAGSAAGSGRPDGTEELADLELEAVAVGRQRLGCRQNLRGGRTGLAGAALHIGDVGGNLLGALRRLLHVAGDFLGRRPLL